MARDLNREPSTDELVAGQVKRARVERDRADAAPDDEAESEHRRRAEKAEYLRDKLAERAESEGRPAQPPD